MVDGSCNILCFGKCGCSHKFAGLLCNMQKKIANRTFSRLIWFYVLPFLVFSLLLYPPVQMQRYHRTVIAKNMHKIYSSIEVYCDNNGGRLPNADHWVDILL